MRTRLAEYSWPEIAELVATDPIAIIPVGAFEQHGHHLPVMVDFHMAGSVAEAAAAAANARGARVVATPPVWTGYSPHHRDFPGTITLDDTTLSALVGHVARSLAAGGFRRIVILNGHGGNANILRNLTQTLFYEHSLRVHCASYWDFALPALAEWRQSPVGGIMHACEMETALMLATRPDLVQMDRAKDVYLDRSAYFGADLLSGGPLSAAATFRELSETGVIGAPTLATAERGKLLMEKLTDAVATFLCDFANWPLRQSNATDESRP
jgi:creatinine amidohydrolase